MPAGTYTKNNKISNEVVNDMLDEPKNIGNNGNQNPISSRHVCHKSLNGIKDNAVTSRSNKGLLLCSSYPIIKQKQLTHSAAFDATNTPISIAWTRGNDYRPDKRVVYQLVKSQEVITNYKNSEMKSVDATSTECEMLHQCTLTSEDKTKNAVAWDFNKSYNSEKTSEISEHENAVAWDINKAYKSDNPLTFNIHGEDIFKPFKNSLNVDNQMSNEEKEYDAKPWVRLANKEECYSTYGYSKNSNKVQDKSPLESLLSVYSNSKKTKPQNVSLSGEGTSVVTDNAAVLQDISQFINTNKEIPDNISIAKQSSTGGGLLDTNSKEYSTVTYDQQNHNINIDQITEHTSKTSVEESKTDTHDKLTDLNICSSGSALTQNITKLETQNSEVHNDTFNMDVNNPSDKYTIEDNKQLNKEANLVGVIDAHVSDTGEIKDSTDSITKNINELNNKSYLSSVSKNVELLNRTYNEHLLKGEVETMSKGDVVTPSDTELSKTSIKNVDEISSEKDTIKTSTGDPGSKQPPSLKILENKIIIVGKSTHTPSVNKTQVTNYYQDRITSLKNKIKTMKKDFPKETKDGTTKTNQTVLTSRINENTIATSANQNAIKDANSNTTPHLTQNCPVVNQEIKNCLESLNITFDNMKQKNEESSNLSSQKENENEVEQNNKTHYERMAELYEYEEKVLGIHPPNSNPFESQEKINKALFTAFTETVGLNEIIEPTNKLMDNKTYVNTNTNNSKENVTTIKQTDISNIKNTQECEQIANNENTIKKRLNVVEEESKVSHNIDAQNVIKQITDKTMNKKTVCGKIDSQSDLSKEKLQYYYKKKPELTKPKKSKKPIEEISVNEFMKITQKELAPNKLLQVDSTFDMREEIQKYLPYKISKAMLQSLFSAIFAQDTRTQNIEKTPPRYVSEEDQVVGQLVPSEQETDETDSENEIRSNICPVSLILMKLNAQRFPMINTKKSAQMYSNVEDLNINADYNYARYKHIPTVSKILNETLPKETERALYKWETDNQNKLGKMDSYKFYQQQLINDVQFHDCVRRHIMGTPIKLLTENASDETRGCLKSLSNVFSRLKDVTVLESPVVHSLLPYQGIVDCIGIYRGNPVVIEWKQADSPRSISDLTVEAPIQLAAYIGAINHDAHYPFPISSGMIVFAYTDGSPADVMQFSSKQNKFFWKLWLRRLKRYLDMKYPK